MLGMQRIVIAQHERGLYLKNRTLEKILEPGVYWVYNPLRHVQVEVFDLTTPEFTHPRVDFLIKESRALCEQYFQVVELGEIEVGLVYKNGALSGVLPPATRQLYWKGPIDVRVDIKSIANDYVVPSAVAGRLAHTRIKTLPAEFMTYVAVAEVPDHHLGLLIVDGALVSTLKPGLHLYWKFNRTVKVEQIDLRLLAMEVSGQEILTKDKVSLRTNLSATYQVADPVKARAELADVPGFLYRELQFALRQAVGTRTLDALLGNKGELDDVIQVAVKAKAEPYGIAVKTVGVKDVILPGDMKEILNKVVEAEKVAEANVIKRREETAATRSLLNTARLMDETPTLRRLKELEVLEKVAEKVDRLTVFGGLEGVLKDTVRINVS